MRTEPGGDGPCKVELPFCELGVALIVTLNFVVDIALAGGAWGQGVAGQGGGFGDDV